MFIVVATSLVLLAGPEAARPTLPPYSAEVPYTNRPLAGDTWQCRSDDVVAGGFRGAPVAEGGVRQIAEVHQEANVTTWRITIREGAADVSSFSGSIQHLSAPDVFRLRRTEWAVVLTRETELALGALAVESITVDLSTSSFVYVGHNVNRLMNKANVWAGACAVTL